jgi:hypothetical protein
MHPPIHLPEGMHLEDYFEAEETEESSKVNHYLEIDDKKYHKSSIVTARLTSKQARKAVMCTLRVRGVTVGDLHQSNHTNWNSGDLLEEDLVKAGDLAAVLVRTDEQICQVVIEIVRFEQGTTKLTAVSMDALENNETKSTVVGQILEMMPSKSSLKPVDWIWTRKYIQFGATTEEEKATTRQFVINIPGQFVHPLAPSVIPTGGKKDDGHTEISSTWSIPNTQLEDILESAWMDLSPDTEEIIGNVDMLPRILHSKLPYRDILGKPPAFACMENCK